MRHTKQTLLAAAIITASTFGFGRGLIQAQELDIDPELKHVLVIGEAVVDATPETPVPAVAGEIPGGMTDSAWKTAFVIGENGHTEAIDLKTGVTKFASASPAIPLGIQGDMLYVLTCKVDMEAQSAEVVVRGMSVSGQGKYIFESKKIPVADWMMSSKGSFVTATAKIDGNKMLLSWEARMNGDASQLSEMGGQWAQQQMLQPNAPAMAEANQNATLAEVNLKTGEVKAIEKKAGEAQQQQQQPPIDANVAVFNEGDDFPVINAVQQNVAAGMPAGGEKIRVTRDGNIYALGKNNGEMQMSCRRIDDQRLLWTHAINPSRVLKTDVMAPEKPQVIPINNWRRLRCGLEGC